MVDAIGLPMAPQLNGPPHSTAFTLSVDAKIGTTTGISAHERAITIARLIARNAKMEDFVSPGHIFPLRAVPGGVLQRPGHTEASVEIARLAGRVPAAVICEIMKPDGTMARVDDLLQLAAKHDLRICTIASLVGYVETISEAVAG
jgi:3,4-dihydroxy 2-butanone 4-phosphate synthase/GTP cyclohydrolase II